MYYTHINTNRATQNNRLIGFAIAMMLPNIGFECACATKSRVAVRGLSTCTLPFTRKW